MLTKLSLAMTFNSLWLIAAGFFVLSRSYSFGGAFISCAVVAGGLLGLLAVTLCDDNCGLIALYYRAKR